MASFRALGPFIPVVAFILLASFEKSHLVNFAAFGRAKVKLQRKAPEEQQPQRRLTKRDKKTTPDEDGVTRRLGSKVVSKASSLNDELEALALQVLPSKEDQQKKVGIWQTLQLLCQNAFGGDVQVWPFGSSANGCGEGLSDLDMVISAEEKPKRRAVQALKKVADVCNLHGFVVLELRPHAKVPILMLQKDGLDVDLSCGNMVPLLNTRLLRSYSLLNPRSSVLAAAVKRWAKAHGIAKTFDGFISSYAWTLMVVYYLQITEQLPSLHNMLEGIANANDVTKTDARYAWEFAALPEAKEVWQLDQVSQMECGELLKGFFEFFAHDFEWATEVVSVRSGQRGFLSSPGRYQNLRKGIGFSHIEDPIDIRRNLNFALSAETLDTMRFTIDMADNLLEQGGGLLDLGILEVPGWGVPGEKKIASRILATGDPGWFPDTA